MRETIERLNPNSAIRNPQSVIRNFMEVDLLIVAFKAAVVFAGDAMIGAARRYASTNAYVARKRFVSLMKKGR